ncbi:hypothetical protein NGRA_2526 [Nosema granulosis]|uniref:Uncharacterized protein n=1 Tax=Nosema granulosis TaxID=83296 RepID=A0A9P6KYC5_9MICR|nr:hypothetical protein NGRA_2526 [Nosema granulosis]
MKIKVNDLEHLLKQIRNLVNPTTKEHNKILNTLKIFLEDNTDVQDPAILSIKQEMLLSRFFELSKTRRESPKELREEFQGVCGNIKKKIEAILRSNVEKVEKVEIACRPIEYDFEDIKKINEEATRESERMDLLTSEMNTKGISSSDRTIINFFKTL